MFIERKEYEHIKKNIPISCVDLLIVHKNQFLLILRKDAPARNLWWFPGGRIYKGESIFQAAIRKGKEELSLDLIPQKIISIEETIFTPQNDEVDVHTINVVVLMHLADEFQKIDNDNTYSKFTWLNFIERDLHPAIERPLLKVNFSYKNTNV